MSLVAFLSCFCFQWGRCSFGCNGSFENVLFLEPGLFLEPITYFCNIFDLDDDNYC